MAGVARSLKDAARLGSSTTALFLRSSEDLVCRNLMCAKLGGACVCRLAVHLTRLSGLRELDIADNKLGVLPDSVFELKELEHLDISGNDLEVLPTKVKNLDSLRTLRLVRNSFKDLPSELRLLPKLEELSLESNLLDHNDLRRELEQRPGLTITEGEESG